MHAHIRLIHTTQHAKPSVVFIAAAGLHIIYIYIYAHTYMHFNRVMIDELLYTIVTCKLCINAFGRNKL